MSGSARSNDDIGELERALPSVANNAQSLDEIEVWIREHPCVKSVQLAEYILKSNPPQRDFIIECETKDGATVKKILNIYILSSQKFRFNNVHDQ